MKRTAVYAGSFDPVTNGHMYMIQEGRRLFDRLIVAVGTNPEKSGTFPVEERVRLLKSETARFPNVKVDSLADRFLIKYAASVKAQYILRGIRNTNDFLFETAMRNINADIDSRITTVFLTPPRSMAEVTSSFVRGLVGTKGWEGVVAKYVPRSVYRAFVKKSQVRS